MDPLAKQRLEDYGWVVGDIDNFLGLIPGEPAEAEERVEAVRQEGGASHPTLRDGPPLPDHAV